MLVSHLRKTVGPETGQDKNQDVGHDAVCQHTRVVFVPFIEADASLLANQENIREIIMFPMNQRAEDLMMGAPSEPTSDQLMELNLRTISSS